MSEMTELLDPPHFGVGRPRSDAASAMPYCVGVKNELVVTWLTNQNCHLGVVGKLPAASAVAAALDERLDVQAEISADAAAVALKSPAPPRSRRLDGPSFMFRVCIASSTTGSTFFIRTSLGPDRPDPRCERSHQPPRGDIARFRSLSGPASMMRE